MERLAAPSFLPAAALRHPQDDVAVALARTGGAPSIRFRFSRRSVLKSGKCESLVRKFLRLALLRAVEERAQAVDKRRRLSPFRQIVGQQSPCFFDQREIGAEGGTLSPRGPLGVSPSLGAATNALAAPALPRSIPGQQA
jgi:hypothetical protein